MRNILLISNYAAPYRGNFIPSLEAIAHHLPKGSKVYYAFPAVGKSIPWLQELAKQHHVEFLQSSFYGKRPCLQSLSQLIKLIRDEHIDIVHTHFIEGNINLWLLKRCTKVRFVANLHNHYIPSGRLWAWRAWLFRNTNDCVIGDSPSVSESAYAIQVKRDKVVTILNSIQFSRLDEYRLLNWRNSAQYALLMFGYPWYRKGVDVVARAVHKLRKEGKLIDLYIAQSGGVEATNEGIKQSLGFLPDWVKNLPPTEQLADYYNSADIFISAGREEGLSYSPIEAAYCQCDVICSDIPGNPTDIPTIGLYSVEDVDELATLIKSRLDIANAEKSQFKQQQRDYVYSHYNVEDWAEEIIKTYG